MIEYQSVSYGFGVGCLHRSKSHGVLRKEMHETNQAKARSKSLKQSVLEERSELGAYAVIQDGVPEWDACFFGEQKANTQANGEA
jgi:hypothetical protein